MKKGREKDNIFKRCCPRPNKNGGGRFCCTLAVCLLLAAALFFNTLPALASPTISAPDAPSPFSPSSPDNAAVFPRLFSEDPVYYAETDNIIAASDSAAVNYFNIFRRKRGLNNSEISEGLSRAALYAAISALCGQRGTETGYVPAQRGTETGCAVPEASSADGLGETFPDFSVVDDLDVIDGFAYVLYDDFTCLNAQKSAEMAVDALTEKLIISLDRSPVNFSEICSFGFASAIRCTSSGCAYCAVICVSRLPMSGSEDNALVDVFPDIMCISGMTSDISEPSANIFGRSANISELPAAISEAPNQDQTSAASLSAAASKTVVLPSVPEGELWNLINYIDVPPVATSNNILCSPLAIGIDDMSKKDSNTDSNGGADAGSAAGPGFGQSSGTDSELVSVPRFTRATIIEESRDGKYLQTEVALEYEGIGLNPVRPLYTDNKGLNVHVSQGSALSEGGHSIIAWLGAETGLSSIDLPVIGSPGITDSYYVASGNRSLSPVATAASPAASSLPYYVFGLELADGTVRKVRKNEPYLVWNPSEEGTVTLTASKFEAGGKLAGSAKIIINVAKKAESVYTEPTLGLTSGALAVPVNIVETEDGLRLVRGVRAGTAAEELAALFVLSGGEAPELTVSKPDGTTLAGDSKVGTGAVIRVMDRGTVYDELYAVITGDVNGDGAVGIADFAKLRQHLLSGNVVTGIYVYAGDLNRDNAIGVADFAKLRQYLLGALELD